MGMRFVCCLALILIIIGALNWGLWGFFQFDFVAWLFGGNTTWLSRLVYAVIGLAGLCSLKYLGKMSGLCGCCGCNCGCKSCGSDKGGKGGSCKS
ncbi:MAG: DUF378 domain-containing protein [Anaplasmataceae bacterium]|nr:DUF378 domain-containing protein [Anaplasmataceae bacterium]